MARGHDPIQKPWPDRRASLYQTELGEGSRSHDGKALARQRNKYVTLPFEVLKGDLMIGLFGELHYPFSPSNSRAG